MLPLDRLRRAGATEDEIAAMSALSETEQLSIEQELQPVAESGVIDFVERFRRVYESNAKAEETEGSGDPVKTAEKASSGTVGGAAVRKPS